MRSKSRLLLIINFIFLIAACSEPQPTPTAVISVEAQEEAFINSFHGTIDNWNQDLSLELMPYDVFDEPQVTLEIGDVVSLNIKNLSRYPISLSEDSGLKLLRYSGADQQWKAVANNVVMIDGSNTEFVLAPKGIIVDGSVISEKHLPVIPVIEEIIGDSITVRAVVTGEIQDSDAKEKRLGAYIDLVLHVK
jgi:hypothetical protein